MTTAKERKIYSKSVKSYYVSPFDPTLAGMKITSLAGWKNEGYSAFSYIDVSTMNPKYAFKPMDWKNGITLNIQQYDDAFRLVKASVTPPVKAHSDGTGKLVSITPNDDYNKRKIIHKISITCQNNIVDAHKDYFGFCILRVKKTIFKDDRNGFNKQFRSREQLIY